MEKKLLVVTGASSGIGKALVYEAVKRGFNVVAAARRINLLEEIQKDIIQKYNVEIAVKECDVTNESACKELMEFCIEKFSRIDVLINNAGISMRALFLHLNLDVMQKVMDVNFWGTVYCTKHALPHLLKTKGSVIGVSSIAGYTGLPGRTAYSASKFAMQGFLGSLRMENLKKGLHVMIACPNFTSSEIRKYALDKEGKSQGDTPLDENKLMSSEQVAYRIMKALRKKQNYIIITTMGKIIVLASRLIPHWYRKRAYKHFANEANSPLKDY
jgi:short-subunit dehydrogenase